eukprot:jgi/Astpho2/1671/Aster-04104
MGAPLSAPTCCHQPRVAWQARRPAAYIGAKPADQFPLAQQPATSFHGKVHASVNRNGHSCGPRRQVTRMMPVSVPKVPYRTPKEGTWQWVDIWNCLYRERIIFLSKPVDESLGNQLVATMLYLDSENHKDLNLYINTSGGGVVPCLALHDTMRHVKSDVASVGFGGCMGMAGFLLAVGKKGKRYVLPNTRIMLHHPSGTARGQASDIQNEARELMRIRGYINKVLSEATGKPIEKVQHDFNRNFYFDANEALEYGIIDRIIKPPRSQSLGV